ncbi:MAG: ribokinase [Clostridia bacterium]|nr:ribokinase [Clostridia bacterium]
MKILNFGSCNIDYVYSLDHIVTPGETLASDNLNIFPGGKGLNQSIALARAGAKVFHAGCVGEGGEILTDILKESGVDTSLIKKLDVKNGHAIIQVNKDGENSIFLYSGSNSMITEEYVTGVLENFEEGDILLLQNEINNVSYIVEQAYKKNMCVIFNPSPFNEKIEEIDFNHLSYIILNSGEMKRLSGKPFAKDSISFIKSKYPKLKIMLTMGKYGCVYIDETTEAYHDTFDVKVIDTTAAGDTFTGYFIKGIADGEGIQNVLEKASMASAIAVSRKGAAPSIPEKEEVEKALSEKLTV